MSLAFGCLTALIIFILMIIIIITTDSPPTILILLFLVGIITSLVMGARSDGKRRINFGIRQKEKITELVNRISGFNPTQYFISPSFDTYIGIDEDNKKICILENKHKNSGELSPTFSKFDYNIFLYDFNEIIQSEILKDGITVSKVSRGSQIGSALVGGALAGGVGAVIGAMGTPSESTTITTSLELLVSVNNLNCSVHKIIFLKPNDLGAFVTGNETKDIYHWNNLLTHIINPSKNENFKKDSTSISLSDKLRELVKLKDEGILTEQEFNQQKQKLLTDN